MKSKISLDKLALAAQQNLKEGQYWLDRLSGEWSKSTFPYDYYRNKKEIQTLETQNTKVEKFNFPPSLLTQIIKLSKGSEVRLHMILVTVLFILLKKYSGNHDILIGSPILKQAIQAEFINTLLVFRNEVEDQSSFKDLLLNLRETIIKANENQNYPFQILLDQLHLKVPDEKEDFPLFDVIILLENLHDKEYIEDINFDILFSFLQTEMGIEGYVEYRETFYRQSTIKQLINHYILLITQALNDINIKVGEISMITEQEKQKILVDFNASESKSLSFMSDQPLHFLFAKQVEKNPNLIALVGHDLEITPSFISNKKETPTLKIPKIQISYSEFNKKSDQLSKILKQKGVNQEKIVGILIESSIQMQIGLMAILKSGGSYLPILPEYPPDRIEYMLNDSGAILLLTDLKHNPGGSTHPQSQNLNIEIESISIDKKIETIPLDSSQPNPQYGPILPTNRNLAYIIYTSGTTGKPKGVMVEHRNVITYLNAFLNEFAFKAGDTVIQLASFTFDVFVEEVFPLLLVGGRIVIPNGKEILDMKRLFQMVIDYGVNIIDCTPVLLNEINKLNPTFLNSVHTFISGGDVLKKENVDNLVKIGKLYNTYGPTESTVCATYFNCSEEELLDERSSIFVPIGKPIDYYKIYILDITHQPVPIGVRGELIIAGDGITRGYLNRPELTAEKYLHSSSINKMIGPYSTGKLYKTGDLARWLWCGNIEFLGRLDQQVKIRGYRIETGEIETQLKKHKDVNDVIVIDKIVDSENIGGTTGEKYLCTFFTANSEITTTQLREFLVKLLPEYMIPAFFMQLEKIPLTPHGKIDRKTLKQIQLLPPKLDTQYEPPSTELEKIIANIWKDILKIENVGIHDRFFDLGGNSIMIIEFSNKLNRLLKKDIPILKMFELATIHKIAEFIDSIDSSVLDNPDQNISNLGKDTPNSEDSNDRVKDISKGKNRRIKRIQKKKVQLMENED